MKLLKKLHHVTRSPGLQQQLLFAALYYLANPMREDCDHFVREIPVGQQSVLPWSQLSHVCAVYNIAHVSFAPDRVAPRMSDGLNLNGLW